MQDIRGRVVRERVINGRLTPVTPVIGHSDWGEIGGNIGDQTDLKNELDKKADKARVDILEKLTLGQVWDYDPYDETVYQQTVPAGGHGVEMESVGGRSVVWNQLVDLSEGTSASTTGITVSFVNGEWVANGTATANVFAYFLRHDVEPVAAKDHKYFFWCSSNKYSQDGSFALRVYESSFSPKSSSDNGSGAIFTATENNKLIAPYLYVPSGSVISDLKYHLSIIDLTLLFGSGNEPTSTSDPRIAWIEAYASEHPEYNAGEVVHGAVTDIIEDGTADEPITYPIPAEVQALEGYGWEGNYIDFVPKEHVKDTAIIDLGTLTYSNASTTFNVYKANIQNIKAGTLRLICTKYMATEFSSYAVRPDFSICEHSGGIEIRDTVVTDATALKASLDGVYLYYELATAIRTDISQYITDEWQTIETEPNGSITFTNDNLLPVPIKDRFKVKLTEALS